ncbi:hypothetical protein X975_25707, partial [Stegodyphus mimosarum]
MPLQKTMGCKTSLNVLWNLMLCFAVIAFVMQYVQASPTGETTGSPFPLCEPGAERRDICERCAKVTKSVLAYPMCCNDEENAFGWCQEFLNYTLPEGASS